MEKRKNLDGKQASFSLYLGKIDQTNPIQFHIKNNFFYQNADIIVFSQSGAEKKNHIDILEEKVNYNKKQRKENQLKPLNLLEPKEESPIKKVKNVLKHKKSNKKIMIKIEKKQKDSQNNVNNNNFFINKYQHYQKSSLHTINQKCSDSQVFSRVLREKSAQELIDYFSEINESQKNSIYNGIKSNLSTIYRNHYSTFNSLNFRKTFNFTNFSNSNTINQTEQNVANKFNSFRKKVNLNSIMDSFRKNNHSSNQQPTTFSNNFRSERRRSFDNLINKISPLNTSYSKPNNSEVSIGKIETEEEESNILVFERKNGNSETIIGNFNKGEISLIKNKLENRNSDIIKENKRTVTKNGFGTHCLPKRFKETYPNLVKKFRDIQEYKANINHKMTKNHLFQTKFEKKLDNFIEKSDKTLEESKEAFYKQDKYYGDKFKKLIYKTLKYEFKKAIKDSPSYLEILRPNIELKEYQYLNNIKPKFKKLGDFRILIVPKEIKDQNKLEKKIVFSDRRVTDAVKNAYCKNKITSLKERKYLEKLSAPRIEPVTNKFIKGMIKTCDFIENENILLTNKIKKVSKRLTKKLDFITANNAYYTTK